MRSIIPWDSHVIHFDDVQAIVKTSAEKICYVMIYSTSRSGLRYIGSYHADYENLQDFLAMARAKIDEFLEKGC